VVTVVNNRADRVSRSEVFAQVLVDDAPAHLHLLIGTNVAGLRGYLETALAARVRQFVLFHREEDRLSADRLETLAQARAGEALARLRLGEPAVIDLAAAAEAMAGGLGVKALAPVSAFEEALAAALASGRRGLAALEAVVAVPLGAALADFARALGSHGPEAVAFLIRLAARHAAVLGWQRQVRGWCASAAGRRACEAAFRALYAALFRASVVALGDPALSGDQVIDHLARACPPGFRVRIMGAQNIKGTGLDFAYRWIAHDRTVRLAASLAAASGEAALALSAELTRTADAGILDGPVALAALRLAAMRESGAVAQALWADVATIEARQRQREEALAQRRQQRGGPLTRALASFVDVHAGVRRRHRADAILDALVAGHVSHDRAARELRDLMKGQKGG